MHVDFKLIFYRPIVVKSIFIFLTFLLIFQISLSLGNLRSLDNFMNEDQAKKDEKKIINQKSLSDNLGVSFFGIYVPKNINDLDIKQSTLNIKIVGILFANDDKFSQVIINTPDKKDQILGVGDTISNGALIKKITKDGILIEWKGALERINLAKDVLIFDAPIKPLRTAD